MREEEYINKKEELLLFIRSIAMPNTPKFTALREAYIKELEQLERDRLKK